MRSGAGWPSALSPETIAATVRRAEGALRAAGCDTPRLDAEVLLGEVLGLDRAGLVLQSGRGLSADEATRFDALVARRVAREPVAYILGRREFRRLTLHVDRRVLIPRPETELLVEVALSLPRGASVLDVGTGSGAVALALADERPDLRVAGVDVSPGAVAVAVENAARLGLAVEFAAGDLLTPHPPWPPDALLANLPYVPDRTELPPDVGRWEPPVALFGGEDGLGLIRRLVGGLPRAVRVVALEVGEGQALAVQELLRGAGFAAVERHRDLAGIERVAVGRR